MELRCPNCGNDHLNWFLRSDQENSTDANTVTILCPIEQDADGNVRGCGENASVHIEDFLETMFPQWTDGVSEDWLRQLMNGSVEVPFSHE